MRAIARRRSMLDFTEEQNLAQQAIRAWCAQHLEPKVLAMESGELSIYPAMREMAATFGIGDMARAAFAKMASRGEGGKSGASSQSSLMAILMMELSRVCPGFALAFGASLGLFGGAV